MTTDMVKNENARKALATAGESLYRKLFIKGASFNASHLYEDRSKTQAETQKLQHLLENHANEKEGWDRCMGATVALIKYAQKMIERAEETIQMQEDRIMHLEKISQTDELTGLTNRRGFYGHFLRELDRCERNQSKGGLLVLIDLDNFKMINDTYGHAAGDACLRLVSRTLEDQIRVMDVAARLGGDEFVLLLANTTKQDAASRAQRLVWNLNHLTLVWHGEEIPVRASLGLRAYKAGDVPDEIFNDADMALYAEKANRKKEKKAKSA